MISKKSLGHDPHVSGLALLCLASVVLLTILAGCTNDSPASQENNIISFKVGDAVGAIKSEDAEISVIVPAGTDLTKVSPVIQISNGATVLPKSEEATDFTHPTTYVVTAANGGVRPYVVTITTALEKIEVVKQPFKTTYLKGEDLDLAGLIVEGTYTGGSVKVETITAANISNYDKDLVGTQRVCVTVAGCPTFFEVTVNDASPLAITVQVGSDRKLVFFGIPAGGLKLSRSSNNVPASVVISIGSKQQTSTTWSGTYWYIDNVQADYNTNILKVDALTGNYTVGQPHWIHFSGTYDGVYYSERIPFEVRW